MNTAALTPRERVVGFFAALAAVALGYGLLLSSILVDDTARYIQELSADTYFWDLGHVWMQPLALWLHRLVTPWLGVNATLEAINVLSVALGAAVFYDTLRAIGHGRLRCALAVGFIAISFNLLSLGPTGHIKLMVFPAMAMSLRHALFWEESVLRGVAAPRHAVAAGAWLGLATSLLVSVLPSALFVGLAMVLRSRQAGLPMWRPALWFGAGLAVFGAAAVLAAYVTALATHTTQADNVIGFVLHGIGAKQDLHVGLASWREVIPRFFVSLVNNFMFLPTLGALGRAWMWGMLPSLAPHAWSLAWQALAAGLSLAAIAAIVVLALRSLKTGGPAMALALGYGLGAGLFSMYYNLNDPEHWFQFTLPVAALLLQARQRWLDIAAFGVWLPLMVAANLGLYGIPKARFDLAQQEQHFQAQLGRQGLYVSYAAYPGEPDSTLLALGGIERFMLDMDLLERSKGDVAQTLARLDERIAATLARGGRVLVFRALDDTDWRGPVMMVSLAGLTHDRLRQHLSQRYRITGPVMAGGFPAWEVQAASR